MLEGDVANHVAAALPWRRVVEQSFFAVQNTDTGRTEHLVTGKYEPVAIQRLHVSPQMRDRLRTIQQDPGAGSMGHVDDLSGRRDGAERVRNLSERHQLGTRVQQFGVFIELQLAVIIDRNHAQSRSLFSAQHLPRHDVGVVLQMADDDFIIATDIGAAPGLGHQIDRLGGAAGEDDLVQRSGIEEAPGALAGTLIGLRHGVGEKMQPAVDVGIFTLIGTADAIQHLHRLLR